METELDTNLSTLVWELLTEVEDPELPVSIVEMGIVYRVEAEALEKGRKVLVEITPTFTSCPAWREIVQRIEVRLIKGGFSEVKVLMNYDVAWTPDKISPSGNEKLRDFGIAKLKQIRNTEIAECPLCSGHNVAQTNDFGPTLCKMIYYCNDCRSPFEVLKSMKA